ncbi:galactose-1-phosphate uridylyltransferase [Parafrankia soli]|uniref:Galactose-1-phosphate uridylyltransferase n=1 Tax=Parafrankia soli TaxID=2599596 RepID=A0A1S1QY51_9ACTN|nr:UDP-glucose--hexose-1-phosphate uridylyltransferase [Parafrankia soli]OHV38546.1 galactose-1-phosphate uridylyltransferase [Parafrankia soli]
MLVSVFPSDDGPGPDDQPGPGGDGDWRAETPSSAGLAEAGLAAGGPPAGGLAAAGPAAHRRHDPLGDRWIIVSAGRVARPWRGGQEVVATAVGTYDPECHLCPGNVRASGKANPDYDGVYVFDNDFPALRPEPADLAASPDQAVFADPSGLDARAAGLLHAEPGIGTCRVVCFDPGHDQSLASLGLDRVRAVVDTWADQERELGRTWNWVQIFENRGAAMGASSPHPHGQIWASSFLPDLAAVEDRTQRDHLRSRGTSLLVDYAALEAELAAADDGASTASRVAAGKATNGKATNGKAADGVDGPGRSASRVVVANDHWLVVVPYWAFWPFETLVLPRRPVGLLQHLTDAERDALAQALRSLLSCYDSLFDSPFPYSMGWHAAPGARPDPDAPVPAHWQLHAHFHPPLLRSPTVRKHLVGYEMFAGVLRDITPEDAAARLRAAGVRAEKRTTEPTRGLTPG